MDNFNFTRINSQGLAKLTRTSRKYPYAWANNNGSISATRNEIRELKKKFKEKFPNDKISIKKQTIHDRSNPHARGSVVYDVLVEFTLEEDESYFILLVNSGEFNK
jgi:hypothetical protein